MPLLDLQWEKTTIENTTVWKASNVIVNNPNGFTLLTVNGTRQVRARYPNGDPVIVKDSNWVRAKGGMQGARPSGEQYPISVTVVNENDESDVLATGSTGVGHPQLTLKVPEIHRRPTRQDYYAYRGGTAERFNTDYNRPFWNTNVDSGLIWNEKSFTEHHWTNASTGVVHMIQSGGWGGWMWSISNIDYDKKEILFSKGGFQEARGGHIKNNQFYVENIKEELDAPSEWFYDTTDGALYFLPGHGENLTDPNLELIASQTKTVLQFVGNYSHPVENIAFQGITLGHTDITFMDEYEVPSGGELHSLKSYNMRRLVKKLT